MNRKTYFAAAVVVAIFTIGGLGLVCARDYRPVREAIRGKISKDRYPNREKVLAQMKEAREQSLLAAKIREELGIQFGRNPQGNTFSAQIDKDDDAHRALVRLSEIRNLTSLSFVEVRLSSDTFKLLRGLRDMAALSFSQCQFKDHDLAVLSHLPSLIAIDFTGVPISDAAIVHFKPLGQLQRLNLSATRVQGSTFDDLRRLPLQELNLSSTAITDDFLNAIGQIQSIRTLYLHNTSISDEGLKHLAGLHQLQYLGIVNTNVTRPGQAAFLKTHEAARTRALGERLISDNNPQVGIVDSARGLGQIASDSGDRQLSAGQIAARELQKKFGVDSWTDMDGNLYCSIVREEDDLRKAVEGLSETRTLQKLTIFNSPVDGEIVKTLVKLPNLWSVSFSGCQISESSLGELKKLPALKELDLTHTPITDASMMHLKNLKKLEMLHLSNTTITGSEFDKLSALPLRHIHLMATPITDDSLNTIGEIPTLQIINLNTTAVTDQGLRHLSDLYRLTSLSIVRTKITQDGKEAFVAANASSRDEADSQGLMPEWYPDLKVFGP